MFSISAGIIPIASFTLFNEILHWPYWISYGIALVLSVLWNFTLNRKITFRSAANVPAAI
ncbi:MAG: GtrA family protein [Clostridia bacterium]|nr:GtrA family protein [Clostridia bacterium]